MKPLSLRTPALAPTLQRFTARIKPQRWLWWLALLGLAIPALWPFWAEGLPRSFDGGLHLLRVGLLDHHLRQGVLYPRWTPELLLGYGYPLFHFYTPLSYYLVEFLHLGGLSYYWAFIMAFVVVVVGAGLGMWRWAADLFGREQRWATLVAATAYMYTPYLYMNIYSSGALPAAAAQALLPWVFWSVRRLFCAQSPKPYLLPAVLSLSALALTHNITTVFLAPVLAGYLLLLWLPTWRQGQHAGWVVLSLIAAIGLSLFFWLPVALERHYLADTAQTLSKTVLLPQSFWTWDNFLDWRLVYTYTAERPIPLGLLQVVVALAGVLLARRWDREWLYWATVALLVNALMGQWALPLWLNNEILSVTQFPWRLLSLSALPMALFAGGLLLRLPKGWQPVATLFMLALIVAAQRPQLTDVDVFSAPETMITLPVFAQVELEKGILGGGEGNSSLQEFRPRWVDRTLALDLASAPTGPPLQIQVETANGYVINLRYSAASNSILRFTTFYFPGWDVQIDGQTPLAPYPDTNLGLLTVAVPAGDHTLQIAWRGTAIQWWANLVSLLTSALIALYSWVARTPLWQRLCASGLWLLLCAAPFLPQSPAPLQSPSQPVQSAALQLLGQQIEAGAGDGHLYVRAYWYVTARPAADLRLRWQLRDGAGNVVTETVARPSFNTLPADNWPPNTLVDDRYELVLPPATAAGSYQLAVAIEQGATDQAASVQMPTATVVGAYTLDQPTPPQPAPDVPLAVRMGDTVRLSGFDLTARSPLFSEPGAPLVVVRSGDYLTYRLYWQAVAPLAQNYHGFVHLTDSNGMVVAQEDHLPGPFFRPPLLWDQQTLQSDAYLLRLPQTLTSGLYWPQIGMYDFATLKRLPVYTADDPAAGDHYRLPPVKVINPPTKQPTTLHTARFGEMATLTGYDLEVPPTGLRPNERLTVTLYYESQAATTTGYVRFLQLYEPTLGMAAQSDSPPQAGANPTWAWRPGEAIVDQAPMVIVAGAKPGRYSLYTGFYHPDDGSRLPAYDATGASLTDNWVKLAEVEVQP